MIIFLSFDEFTILIIINNLLVKRFALDLKSCLLPACIEVYTS